MPTFRVKIQAKITKTEIVEAIDAKEAEELAHEQFSVLNDDTEEKYEQDTLEVAEVQVEEMGPHVTTLREE